RTSRKPALDTSADAIWHPDQSLQRVPGCRDPIAACSEERIASEATRYPGRTWERTLWSRLLQYREKLQKSRSMRNLPAFSKVALNVMSRCNRSCEVNVNCNGLASRWS